MPKSIFLVCLSLFLLFSKNCNSQKNKSYFGLCGGVSYFKFKAVEFPDVYIAEYSGKLNFTAGFSFLFHINRWITFNTALKFASKNINAKWLEWTIDSLLNINVIDRSKTLRNICFEIPGQFSFIRIKIQSSFSMPELPYQKK